MSMCPVCMFTCQRIEGTTRPNFTQEFLCVLPIAVVWFFCGGAAICYVLPVLWNVDEQNDVMVNS